MNIHTINGVPKNNSLFYPCLMELRKQSFLLDDIVEILATELCLYPNVKNIVYPETSNNAGKLVFRHRIHIALINLKIAGFINEDKQSTINGDEQSTWWVTELGKTINDIDFVNGILKNGFGGKKIIFDSINRWNAMHKIINVPLTMQDVLNLRDIANRIEILLKEPK